MRRRDFITLLGGAAALWPLSARAQQSAMPVIGFLYLGTSESQENLLVAFRKGLSETGYTEGRNLEIQFRWANNELDQLPALAQDLVRRGVAVIVAPGAMVGGVTAGRATTTIPIVFEGAGDPVALGLAASLSHPGGNVTGLTTMSVEVTSKLLGILHSLLPGAERFAALVHPRGLSAEPIARDLQKAATAIGLPIEILTASTADEIDAVFNALAQKRISALALTPHPLFNNSRVQIVGLAARYRIPAIYDLREFVEVGGLMSYSAEQSDPYYQVGLYTGRILKGEKPADLPVMQATKFQFVINQATAKALGLTVPPILLAIADEVME
jgi:putative tryptophan/tyrosine transport system substrate-binding protein